MDSGFFQDIVFHLEHRFFFVGVVIEIHIVKQFLQMIFLLLVFQRLVADDDRHSAIDRTRR